MKRLMLACAAVCAVAALPVLPASAMPFGSQAPAVTQTDEDAILVRHRNRGHHYGWNRGRGHHYGWNRGHHYGWSRHNYYRG